MSGKSAECCLARPVRPITWTAADIGNHRMVLEHDCKCGSCCRRVAVWQVPATPVEADDYLVKVIARVVFGCRNSCFASEVEVDVKQGVVLDLFGDFIQVMLEPVEVSGTVSPLAYGAMSACCGAGTARGCATRTTRQFTIAAAGTAIIPVPPYAYAVQFVHDFASFGIFFVSNTSFFQSGSGTGAPITYSPGDTLPDPWTIVNGAESIVVINGGAGPITFEAVFLIGV